MYAIRSYYVNILITGKPSNPIGWLLSIIRATNCLPMASRSCFPSSSMMSVVGGITTAVLAMREPPAMVVDDYSRIGLATHRRLARDERA